MKKAQSLLKLHSIWRTTDLLTELLFYVLIPNLDWLIQIVDYRPVLIVMILLKVIVMNC